MSKAGITALPEVIGFKFPCDGKEGQTKLKIINGTKEKQTFKVKLTRPERFRIGPPFGFIEPDGIKMVRIKPNAFDGVKPLSKTDRFTILVAPAPPGNAKPSEIWKTGSPLLPKNPKKCVVKIQYCKEGEPCPPGATEGNDPPPPATTAPEDKKPKNEEKSEEESEEDEEGESDDDDEE